MLKFRSTNLDTSYLDVFKFRSTNLRDLPTGKRSTFFLHLFVIFLVRKVISVDMIIVLFIMVEIVFMRSAKCLYYVYFFLYMVLINFLICSYRLVGVNYSSF